MTRKKEWKRRFRDARKDLIKANEKNEHLTEIVEEQAETIRSLDAEVLMLRSTWTAPPDRERFTTTLTDEESVHTGVTIGAPIKATIGDGDPLASDSYKEK